MSNETLQVPRWILWIWALGHVAVFLTPICIIQIMYAKQFLPTWPVTIGVYVFLGHIAYVFAGVAFLHGRRLDALKVGIKCWLICMPVWIWAIFVLLQNGN